MIRKAIAALLSSYLEFIKRRPLASLAVSLALLAALLGAFYLVFRRLPDKFPCFPGCQH